MDTSGDEDVGEEGDGDEDDGDEDVDEEDDGDEGDGDEDVGEEDDDGDEVPLVPPAPVARVAPPRRRGRPPVGPAVRGGRQGRRAARPAGRRRGAARPGGPALRGGGAARPAAAAGRGRGRGRGVARRGNRAAPMAFQSYGDPDNANPLPPFTPSRPTGIHFGRPHLRNTMTKAVEFFPLSASST